MKRALTSADVEPAVYGGAILGGGGGGHIRDGLELGQLAVDYGEPELWSVDELAPDDLVAICAGVGAPGAPDRYLKPVHYVRALDQLRRATERAYGRHVVGLASNENGALGTVNGWLQSALTGLPVLDAPCNGRAHPSAAMGSLGLHRDPDYLSVAGFAGGRASNYVEGVLSGRLDKLSSLVRTASITAGGLVAVARNPVPVQRLVTDAGVGGISQAIDVGQAWLDGGPQACAAALGGRLEAHGTAVDVRLEQRGGFDVGGCVVDGLELRFVNEYLTADRDGVQLAAFPDLTMTFDAEGRPLVSADLATGAQVSVLVAPADQLRLSSTMAMPELLDAVTALLPASR